MFGIDDIVLGAAVGMPSAIAGAANTLVNINQARVNRQFQADMSSTAYQRAMADMRAAGLNPMLAYQQGGASTPGGSTASGALQAPDVASALQLALQRQEQDNRNRQTDKDLQVKQGQADLLAAQTQTERNRPENIAAATEETRSRIGNISADTANKLLEPARIRADILLKQQSASAAGTQSMRNAAETFLTEAQTELTKLKAPEARLWASFYTTIAPFAGAIARTVNILGDKLNNYNAQEAWDAINRLLNNNTDAQKAWNQIRDKMTDQHMFKDSPVAVFLRMRQAIGGTPK